MGRRLTAAGDVGDEQRTAARRRAVAGQRLRRSSVSGKKTGRCGAAWASRSWCRRSSAASGRGEAKTAGRDAPATLASTVRWLRRDLGAKKCVKLMRVIAGFRLTKEEELGGATDDEMDDGVARLWRDANGDSKR